MRVAILCLPALASVASAQEPRFLAWESDVTQPDYILNIAPHDYPPFLHWDLREFPDCKIPWSLSPVPVPDLDQNGMADTAADRAAAVAEFGQAFASWASVSPAVIDFVGVNPGDPQAFGMALDANNTLGFLDAALDDVQEECAPPLSLPCGGIPPGSVIVSAGPNGLLETVPQGDDRIAGTSIVDGGNGIAESRANNQGGVDGVAGGTLAIAGLFFDNQSGVILEADIVFDTAETWALGLAGNAAGSNTFNLRATALHEIGHFLGIAHCSFAHPGGVDANDGITPTMYSSVNPFDGDSFNTTLEPADCDALRFLYSPDLGDAPDPFPFLNLFNYYPTLVHGLVPRRVLNGVQLFYPAYGAEHLFGTFARNYQYEWLGPAIDDGDECEALPVDQFDDGVEFEGAFQPGGPGVDVKITVSTNVDRHMKQHAYLPYPIYVNGWFDWNADGDWDDVGEHVIGSGAFGIAVAPLIVPSTEILIETVIPPAGATPGGWARFRLDWGEDVGQDKSFDETLNLVRGAAQFGEVEDYEIPYGPSAPMPYCSAKSSSAGCLASIGTSVAAQPVSGASGYSVLATGVHSFKNGLLFGSPSGAAAFPFNGGTLCVNPPLKRGPIVASGGAAANTCTGAYATEVNDGVSFPSGLDAGAGGSGWYQYWYRDPQNGAGNLGTALSNAVQLDFQ